MRTIKFRAWTGKEMIYFTLDDIDCGSVIGKKSAACVKQSCDETHHIQQFTGLLDKNGKEIYEGDIVMIVNYGSMNGEKYKVEIPSFYLGIGAENLEVIGNVMENPELLK